MAALPISTNLEVWVRRFENRFGSEIFLIRNLGAGRRECLSLSDQKDHSGAPMWESKILTIGEGEAIHWSELKCFVSVDEVMLRELMMAFTRYADEQGIPRPAEDHMKGKLEATEKHLQDVQNMLSAVMRQNSRLLAMVEKEAMDGNDRSSQGSGHQGHGLLESAQ